MIRFMLLLILGSSTAQPLFSQASDTVFTRCLDVPDYPYYYPKLKYEGDFWAIKKHFYEGFASQNFTNLSDNNGIATVHFWVNCKGMSGNFTIECYGLDYTPMNINENIVNHIILLTKELNGWIPAMLENGQVVNSHKFFSFRISHGKLVDILPQ